MVTPNEIPRLRPDAEQLLQRLAEMRTTNGYQQCYEINKDLLEKLGFADEEKLKEAAQSLDGHAHDYKDFWQGHPPVIDVKDDVSPKMLNAPSFIRKSWESYQTRR